MSTKQVTCVFDLMKNVSKIWKETQQAGNLMLLANDATIDEPTDPTAEKEDWGYSFRMEQVLPTRASATERVLLITEMQYFDEFELDTEDKGDRILLRSMKKGLVLTDNDVDTVLANYMCIENKDEHEMVQFQLALLREQFDMNGPYLDVGNMEAKGEFGIFVYTDAPEDGAWVLRLQIRSEELVE